jgi:hypothetical protein
VKLSGYQALVLLTVLRDSLVLSDGGANPFCYTNAARRKIFDDIVNQQPRTLEDTDERHYGDLSEGAQFGR